MAVGFGDASPPDGSAQAGHYGSITGCRGITGTIELPAEHASEKRSGAVEATILDHHVLGFRAGSGVARQGA
jgi:hypothetical protein